MDPRPASAKGEGGAVAHQRVGRSGAFGFSSRALPGWVWVGPKAGSRSGLSSQSKRKAVQKVLKPLQLTLIRYYLLLLRAGAARCCCCVSLSKIQRRAESLSPFSLRTS